MPSQPAPTSARIEIDCATLARLLARGQMQACELKCLDAPSKHLVRKLCLDTCLKACTAKNS